MTPSPIKQAVASNDSAPACIQLNEWACVTSKERRELAETTLAHNIRAQQVAEQLRGRLTIRNGFQGLEIESTSFVGHVDVGPLRISIQPKLPGVPLTRLFRYAYGLNDMAMIDQTEIPLAQLGLEDLLILMLVREAELLSLGRLARQYIAKRELLASPRGSILVSEIARRGGITEAALPCRYFERHLDWHLNRILRAGLALAAGRASDKSLRRRVFGVARALVDVDGNCKLNDAELDHAERGLNRLTAIYQPALTLIRLLVNGLGPGQEATGDGTAVPGFLFDMNVFFQKLLSRFLHENSGPFRVADERSISGALKYLADWNPKKRTAHNPRPDYTVFEGRVMRGFLDAKYRDVWNQSVPAGWLYQMAIYALNSPTKTGVLLYATTDRQAREERIDVRGYAGPSTNVPTTIMIRPVILTELLSAIEEQGTPGIRKRQEMARRYVNLG
jgi:5-methylcytosine-specific restriction enzyme subunit McrC